MAYTLTKENGDKILKEDGGLQILEVLKQIENFQSDYILTNQKYFQALPTHVVPPEGNTAPDNLATVIPSKNTKWDDTNVIVGNNPYSIEMIEYLVPEERQVGGSRVGYEIKLRKKVGLLTYYRTIGYGPEAVDRTTDGWLEEQ